MDEVWRPIPGFEGYEVSNCGRVRSLDRIDRGGRRRKGKMLALTPAKDGYPRVNLDGRGSRYLVHRLVALAFYGEPREAGLQVNHINGDRADPRVDNLEWVTPAENQRHSYRVLGRKPREQRGEANTHARLTARDVMQIRARAKPYRWGIYSQLAREYGVTPSAVMGIVKGLNWRHV